MGLMTEAVPASEMLCFNQNVTVENACHLKKAEDKKMSLKVIVCGEN
jgi:hypothetical protein